MALRILAILAARNERDYIANCIRQFCACDIDVVLLDNDSTDDTVSVARPLIGDRGRIERLPYLGSFSLTAQLEAKDRIARTSTADWIVHVDADEILQSPIAGESLRAAIERVDASGANCINFEEFVFLPIGTIYDPSGGPVQRYGTYYFFASKPQRLMRCWRRDADLSNIGSGGHHLDGTNLHCFTTPLVLRHYIVRSQEHAFVKYGTRSYSGDDLAKGWHRNRLEVARERLVFPTTGLLDLQPATSMAFDRTRPFDKHYWQW